MRTVLRVMLSLLLFFACCAASAQEAPTTDMGSVDADITIVGRDDTVIPVPPPPALPEMPLPPLDATPLEPFLVPAITPPPGEWTPGSDASPLDVLGQEGLE